MTRQAMDILVCVKQVPDVEQIDVVEGAGGRAAADTGAERRMNRFDEFAVEEAVRLKEAADGLAVDVLTVGPEKAQAVVKRAVGMGADRGVLLQVEDRRDGEDAGPSAVATLIANYLRRKPYALVLFGSMSEDGMHGQVGPMAAALAERPYATQIISLDLSADLSAVSVQREVEGGARERLRMDLPAVLCLQPGINRPRYPSLSNLLRANRQAVDIVAADTQQKRVEPVVYLGAALPPRTRAGEVITGSLQEKAEWFVNFLRQKAFVR